jgi:hypothetical protein
VVGMPQRVVPGAKPASPPALQPAANISQQAPTASVKSPPLSKPPPQPQRIIPQNSRGPQPPFTSQMPAGRSPTSMPPIMFGGPFVPSSPQGPSTSGPPRPPSSQTMYGSVGMGAPGLPRPSGPPMGPPFAAPQMAQHPVDQMPPIHNRNNFAVSSQSSTIGLHSAATNSIANGHPPVPSPIGPSNATSTAASVSSQLAALNMGSQPVEKRSMAPATVAPISAPGHGRRASHTADVGPIGRPRELDGTGSAPSSSAASLRSASPPPLLGPSALLDDIDEPVMRPHVKPTSVPPFTGNSFAGVFGPPPPGIINGASDPTWGPPRPSASAVWGAPPAMNGWAQPPTPVGPPKQSTRATIISERARVAFEKMSSATKSNEYFMAGDLYQFTQNLFPDQATFTLREFVDCCYESGIWGFTKDNSGRLHMRHDPSNPGIQQQPSPQQAINPIGGMRTF